MRRLFLFLLLLFPVLPDTVQLDLHAQTPIAVSCIKTSQDQFSGGIANGAWDDGRGFALSDGIHMFAGTDNATVFNQHYRSSNHGVTWVAQATPIWSARNAMGAATSNDTGFMWGGNDLGGTLRDSYKYIPGVGWVLISADMGTSVYGSSRAQFAWCKTRNWFLVIGGLFSTDCIGSPDLTTNSWVVRGTIPLEIQGTIGSTACYDSTNNIVYLTGGQHATTGDYITKVWKSLDEGATWLEVATLPAHMQGEWANMVYTKWGLVYLCGHNSDLSPAGNQKGLYYSTDWGVTWLRFKYEPSARHASFFFESQDKERAYLASGNFWNDSFVILRLK